jgi:hypothetical protein
MRFVSLTARNVLCGLGAYGVLWAVTIKQFRQLSLDPYKTSKIGTKTVITNNGENIVIDNQYSLNGVLENVPSVDYFSCCGAGHRFTKLADSYYLAKRVGFSLRVFFGFCDHQEVYSHFFGPQPVEEVLKLTFGNNNSSNLHIKVNNEVPGFTKLIREGPNSTCRCDDDRFDADIELFTGLRNRFRDRGRVDRFREEYFDGHTVIGLHIRAGNNEQGDFVRKNRTIQNTDQWSESMADLLVSLAANFTNPPLLFLATDTAAILSKFETLLQGKIPVVHLTQHRVEHGKGVLFGEGGSVETQGEACLNGWSDSFSDMMLLSHADVVIAGRPSSFTQSIPMTMVLSTPKEERKVLQSFCEVNPAATEMVCYEDLKDWCCRGVTSFSLHSIQRYDYRRMPRIPGLDPKDFRHHLKVRPEECTPTPHSGRECLPYEMPDAKSLRIFIAKDKKKRRLHHLQQKK